jgi:hypothetical protein
MKPRNQYFVNDALAITAGGLGTNRGSRLSMTVSVTLYHCCSSLQGRTTRVVADTACRYSRMWRCGLLECQPPCHWHCYKLLTYVLPWLSVQGAHWKAWAAAVAAMSN